MSVFIKKGLKYIRKTRDDKGDFSPVTGRIAHCPRRAASGRFSVQAGINKRLGCGLSNDEAALNAALRA
jgi:hypothetical protein